MPAIKLGLLVVAAVILVLVFNLVKKAVVITVIAALVLIGLNALGLYNMKTDPKDLIGQISSVASDNSETIVTATNDLFYQSVSYATAVNPIESALEFANGADSFWYMAEKDAEVDFTQDIFKGYYLDEEKEVGEFKAYRLVKASEE